jgi:hypothetical protein
MRVYIASHCRWAGLYAAARFEQLGHEVTARWLHEPFGATGDYSEAERQRIARMDADDVARADALVLIAGPDKYSGGKFIEAGIAIGMGKRVVIIGRRENMLLWLPEIECFNTPEDAARALPSMEAAE